MTNICRVLGCSNETIGKAHRCSEHATVCLAEDCDIPTTAVRCSKHAGRFSRMGHSYLSCEHTGCLNVPPGDRKVCTAHQDSVSELQERLDAAFNLLSQYGTVRFYPSGA